MKKIFLLLFLPLLLMLGIQTADGASLWTKHVAADKSYSFHYPSGWKVLSHDSVTGAENTKTGEQLIMAMLPFDQLLSPQDLANEFLGMLQDGNPGISASNWRSSAETAESQVLFDLTGKSSGKEYSGLGFVVKTDQQAIWFSYLAPESDYYQIRGFNILQGFISSMDSGSASKAPDIDYTADVESRIDSNARAFLFLLEFALGAPFIQSQEAIILEEIKDSWRYLPEEELKKYDEYPALVKAVFKMKQKDLEKLRKELETAIREWLNETDQSDPAVKIINKNLKSRGKIVIKGEPPLTEMSLTAYSEIIAYSRLLQKDPEAKPDQISQKSVKEIKKQVKKVWKSFSEKDKQDIATAPGLWVCLRAQLEYGKKEDRDIICDSLKKLEAVTRDIETKKPMSNTAHWCLMQMKQQTFNTYMWSRGFNYHPTYGKMW